jgi:hypothetical protein
MQKLTILFNAPNVFKTEMKTFYNHHLLYTGSYPVENSFYLIWFQDEDKYSIVEKKNIVEKEVNVREMLTVKGAKGRWTGRLMFVGMYFKTI